MERLEELKLESLMKKIDDNYLTMLGVYEDRVSYGVIVQATAVSPYVLFDLMKTPSLGIEMKKYKGLQRLCFYFLKDNW